MLYHALYIHHRSIHACSTLREELFAYPIDWEVLDRHDIVRGPMQLWVTKKIVEYLGVEEESLTEFIIGNGWIWMHG